MNSTKLFAVIAVAFSVFASTSAFAKTKPVCNYGGGQTIHTNISNTTTCVNECLDVRCIACEVTTTQTGTYSCNNSGGGVATQGTITITNSGGIRGCGGLGFCAAGKKSNDFFGDEDMLGSHQEINVVAVPKIDQDGK